MTERKLETRVVIRGKLEAELAAEGVTMPEHNCEDHWTEYVSSGALGHGFECGVCGKFLQAG